MQQNHKKTFIEVHLPQISVNNSIHIFVSNDIFHTWKKCQSCKYIIYIPTFHSLKKIIDILLLQTTETSLVFVDGIYSHLTQPSLLKVRPV